MRKHNLIALQSLKTDKIIFRKYCQGIPLFELYTMVNWPTLVH